MLPTLHNLHGRQQMPHSTMICQTVSFHAEKVKRTIDSLFLVVLFIYISNVIPLPSFLSQNHPSQPFPSATLRVFPHPPSHSLPISLAFPYTGASSLHRIKGLPSTRSESYQYRWGYVQSFGSYHSKELLCKTLRSQALLLP